MNKDFWKNNFFIIAFGITFVIFIIGWGIKSIPTNHGSSKNEENITNESIIANNDVTSNVIETSNLETTSNNENTLPEETTPEETSIEEKVDFVTADDSYLDGALFIGDSRTDTLASYAGWTKTEFWVKTGLTIWDVLDEKIAKVKGKTVSVKKALKEKQYDKIYIMLGVNELGTGTATTFCEQYKKVIDYMKKNQPNAVIYIQSIIHVTNDKRSNSSYINNKNVDARNAKIIDLADNKQVFWLDLNEIFDKRGTGVLNKKYTSDGVHIMPKYIPEWKEYLLSHVVEK